jgi:uncharacterized repeat protein (TIGR03803 family)
MSCLSCGVTAIAPAALLAAYTLPSPAATIYDFKSPSADGSNPSAALIVDVQGALYGTTVAGGPNNAGVVFRLTPPGPGQQTWTRTVLHNFRGEAGNDGASPVGRLTMDRRGVLYGTAEAGGIEGAGIVFMLTPAAEDQTAWTETVLYRFKGRSDGSNPIAGLVADRDGALYGTTLFGGAPGKNGHGTVFKLTPPAEGKTEWTESVIYRFKSGGDGANPYSALIIDNEGALYGTTLSGGTVGAIGFGTAFKLSPPAPGAQTWRETILHRFAGPPGDGDAPQGGLIAAKDGALYGATFLGGSRGNKGAGFGTIFRLTPPEKGQTAWTETLLYRFCAEPDCADGSIPEAGLIADEEGALYGAAQFGGRACALYPESGCGVIFKLAPPTGAGAAWAESVVLQFAGPPDGASPFTALSFDRQGALYGTTPYGGGNVDNGQGYGTVFRLTLCPEPDVSDRREPGQQGDRSGCPAFLSMK